MCACVGPVASVVRGARPSIICGMDYNEKIVALRSFRFRRTSLDAATSYVRRRSRYTLQRPMK